MKVSAISQISSENCKPRRSFFIQMSNSFMSAPTIENPVEKANEANTGNAGMKKLGIENLQEFTIFPKEVKEGQTIITA